MKYISFAIRDSAVQCFMVPMYFQSKGQAIRAFTDEVNRVDVNNNLNKHPADFGMYEIGTYDDETGQSMTLEPTLVVLASDVIIKN
ncbi:MAG: nonstructural protein [Microvirus sp.]|nr:MAG: nonstructural protein [Microvirus sp.]